MNSRKDGLPPQVSELIGRRQYEMFGDVAVEQGAIENYCAAVRYGNPLYWSEDCAVKTVGYQFAPPSMISTWFRPHHWKPGADEPQLALRAHFDLKMLLELPEAIISDNELTFGAPARVGERILTYQVVKSISDYKTTRLGIGRFWVVDVVIENEEGVFLGSDSYTAFGYVKQ